MTSVYRPLSTKEFQTNNALNVLQQLQEGNNVYYLGIGKNTQWDASETDNLFRPPYPADNQAHKQLFWQDAIGYLKVAQNSVRLVHPRLDWGDPTRLNSKTYNVGDIIVTNTIVENQTAGQNDGYMVYRCITGNDGSPLLGEGTTFPTGENTYIETGDGYAWEYMYTIPQDEITKFVTPEYIVVPTPDQLKDDEEKWFIQNVSRTVFDEGRQAFVIGANKLMFYTLIEDYNFTEMLSTTTTEEQAFRKVGLILNPYVYTLAPDVTDLDGDPVYFSESGEGGASIDGWKIVAESATSDVYTAAEVLQETGELIYMENRAPVFRSFNQLEEIRIVLSF